ncbi:hypothetical protein NIES2101_15770 [Calothrix sp. HK-06]|nr:hypothetical protein NIES2101_15770 [Calothrix sp. HK-06]
MEMKKFYDSIYHRSKTPEQLPWHREVFPPSLTRAVRERTNGKALDLGCGSGVYAVYLAQHGFDVTAIDFVPDALEMVQQRAKKMQVTINFVEADVLEWKTDDKFDLVFDSGCLHGIANIQKRLQYKQQILKWLTPNGSFVLSHFNRRNFFDWRPIGPIRKIRSEINSLFAPELIEKDYDDEIASSALPVGPTVKIGNYLFERSSSI